MREEIKLCDKLLNVKIIDIIRTNVKQDLYTQTKNTINEIRNNYSFSKFLFDSLRYTIYLIIGITWIAGFVIAKGFWSTFFCIIPFYSWYLIVEMYFTKYGI